MRSIYFSFQSLLTFEYNWIIVMEVRVSKKPVARFRPGPARPEPVYGRAGPRACPARRPAPLKKTTKIKSIKKNILYFYIYITNSFNKHKRNVAQLVRALKFKLEGVQIPPSPFLYLKAILAYLKKPAARPVGPAR